MSWFLTEFYTKKVLAVVLPALVPEDDDAFESCMTDGSNDHGIDFIYRNQGRVLIVQTKYSAKGSISKEDIEACRCVLSRLHAASENGAGLNRSLREALAEIDWESDTFDVRFIALAKASTEIEKLAKQGIIPVSGLDDILDRSAFTLQCESDLNEMLREALNQEDYVNEEVSLILSATQGESPWLTYSNSHGRTCYIGRIRGNQIAPLVKKYPSRLFSLNIRSYLGDQATNKSIVKSAIETPEDFFFFNNGVSAVATSIVPDVDKGTLTCKRLSIINGAQTVTAIKRAFYDDESRQAANTEVLIRITETTLSSDSGQGNFLERATQYNNTQNTIKIADFRSNDDVQKDLRRKFDKLSYPGGKKLLYKNKREKTNTKNVVTVGMEDFTKSLHSLFYGPADYYGGSDYLFDPGPNGGYIKVFGDGKKAWNCVDKADFQKLSGGWFLCSVISEYWKSIKEAKLKSEADRISRGQQKELIAKPALERRWLIYYVVGLLIIRKHGEQGLLLILQRLSKPDWITDPKADMKSKIREYVQVACELLETTYLQESIQPGFGYRNFYRNQKHLTAVESIVDRSGFLIEKLAPL